MKKILSILLVMALCLGLFAACNANPTEPATSNLANAKKLVFNTYKPASKDEVPVKSADFELLSSVLVEGVSYPVEWTVSVTAGPADAVKLDGNKVDLTEKPAEEVKFTLTATIKDEKGNTETVSFNFMTPAFEAPAADKVVIKNVAENKYTTGIEYKYTSSSGKVKMELPLTESKAEAIAFTLVNNDDGSVSFKTDCGKYLFCDANSVEFADEMGDYTKFILDVAEGGYYVKCAVANYNGNPQYLEIYSGYLTCYGLNDSSNHDLYIFALEDASGANGKVEKYVEGSAPETTVPPTQDSNDPAADSTLSIKDALALGASKAHNTYTAGKYYVTGVITEVYSEQYGNMKITDAEGNILTIYGTYDADGTNRYDAMAVKPVAGDTVTIYGIVGQYNDTPQIKNGWITAHTPAGSAPEVPETTAPAAPETTAPAGGNEGGSLQNGAKVVIWAPAYGKAFSSEKTSHYNVGVDVSGDPLTGFGDTEIFTVIVNDDGTYSFEQNGQKLGMEDQYSSLNLGAAHDKWELTSLGNGLYWVKNVVRGNYIEWYNQYNNWSSYTKPEGDDQYELSFFVVG